MTTSIIPAKYQIIIPKDLRVKAQIQPGQKVYLSSSKHGEILIKTITKVSSMYGTMKDAWGKDSDEYLRQLREGTSRD